MRVLLLGLMMVASVASVAPAQVVSTASTINAANTGTAVTGTSPGRNFDYYTLALSLTPAFCDQNPKWRDSLQCRDRLPLTVHGLWPERAQGRAPEFCQGGESQISADLQKRLRGVMPDASLRQHEWKKHGRCSGLAAEAYFARIEREFLKFKVPTSLQPQGRDAIVQRDVLLQDIRRLNPALPEQGIVLRCERRGRPPLLTEIRLCLSPAGAPQACAANYRPNCPLAIKVRAR